MGFTSFEPDFLGHCTAGPLPGGPGIGFLLFHALPKAILIN